jgi:peptidoglycan/LPS O-acetylase OafA/YrhL
LQARWLRAVGRVSYGLYIWHGFVFVAIHHWRPNQTFARLLPAALSITVACTLVSWFCVEKPLHERMGRRARRARRSEPVVGGPVAVALGVTPLR